MQNWPTESSESSPSTNPRDTLSLLQDGFCREQSGRSVHLGRTEDHRGISQHPQSDGRDSPTQGVHADDLDQQLLRLSLDGGFSGDRCDVPGQRIIEYENSLAPSIPTQALGFKVMKRAGSDPQAVHLADLPNEVLTHILSHLHPDSHASVALVSKRFYSLVTTPHAWRMAFLRYFPGHGGMATKPEGLDHGPLDHGHTEEIRAESRSFARLTSLATWRSEYLLRTRLLRGLVRGKPGSGSGGIGSSARASRKAGAVLTYNSKLPWAATNLDALFSNGSKRPPRAVHGSADLGIGTMSDPTTGRVEKWGFDDPFSSQQLDEVFPGLEPFGVSDGPAACPNVMDVSSPFGLLAGEGFPGGQAYYRPINEKCGRYLGHEPAVVDTYPDIPKIPELSEAVSSVWIAKSSAVPIATQSMIGLLTGSTLGVITAYALGGDSSGARFSNGDMTLRWVISPGIPIIAIKVDDQYNYKRRAAKRVWAVALNALGEVYYLTEAPRSKFDCAKGEDITKSAWYAGRSLGWQLLEYTRRRSRPDHQYKNMLRGAYSPRSPSDAMGLSKEQLIAEAREIEKFLRHKPSHFRKVCEGWDMRRMLEVDFANDDRNGAGEIIVVITRGWEAGQCPEVSRYRRSVKSTSSRAEPPDGQIVVEGSSLPSSIFGTRVSPRDRLVESITPDDSLDHTLALPLYDHEPTASDDPQRRFDDWDMVVLGHAGHQKTEITASALDVSHHASLTCVEDPLADDDIKLSSERGGSDFVAQVPPVSAREIPGRRARMVTLGTKNGTLLSWNIRESAALSVLEPICVLQTESPEISCLASNGLYIVHGGSDGLVQAWDLLASTQDPLRTLNTRPSGRIPRHMLTLNPALRDENYSAARAIVLDPDPTILRGVVSFGAFLRYWTYSAISQPPGRKRRLRHSDVHGRLASRRQGGKVAGYIAAETAELRHEQEHGRREQVRLQNRFGVGAFGDLTEEEAMRYAEMISEESFTLDEQRRTSASDTGSAANASIDTASSFSESTISTVTPEPSIVDAPSSAFDLQSTMDEAENEYNNQIQQALRLSLLEDAGEQGYSPPHSSSDPFGVPIVYKPPRLTKGGRQSTSSSASASCPPISADVASSSVARSSSLQQEEDDLALAMKLSLEQHDDPFIDGGGSIGAVAKEEFPSLQMTGKGKGKAKM